MRERALVKAIRPKLSASADCSDAFDMRLLRRRSGYRCGLGRGKLKEKAVEEHGQMTVELCVVFPVVLIIAVIAVNAMAFFGDCAEFDRVSRNAIRQIATSPAHEQTVEQSIAKVQQAVESSLGSDNLECEASALQSADGFIKYTVTVKYAPTLFGLGLKEEVFGVALPKLSHTTELTVDSYKPGMLF